MSSLVATVPVRVNGSLWGYYVYVPPAASLDPLGRRDVLEIMGRLRLPSGGG